MDKIVRVDDENGDEIELSVKNKQLGNFVTSILGQPQSIGKTYIMPFYIDYIYLKNLIELIKQRLGQQNHHEIVMFQAVIGYEDNTNRTINSIEALEAFSENLDLISISLSLTFKILIQFPRKEKPEIQEINISFRAARRPENFFNIDDFNILDLEELSLGVISVHISHTERTWANDLLTLIDGSLKKIKRKEPSYKGTIRKYSTSKNQAIVILSIFLVTIFGLNIGIENSQRAKYLEYLDISSGSNNNIQSLHLKVDYLSSRLIDKIGISGVDITIYDMGVFISMVVIYFIFTDKLDSFVKPPSSFVVLTDSTKRFFDAVSDKNKIRARNVSIIGALLLGLIINFSYELLKVIIPYLYT